MYNTSKLSPASVAYLAELGSSTANIGDVIPMALARAISAVLMLPTSEVKNPGENYITEVYKTARSSISDLSDLFVFDTKRVEELVRVLWLVRYKAAFPTDTIYSTFNLNTESTFLGYGSVMSAPDIKFIQDNTPKLISLYNKFAKIIREISGHEEQDENEFKVGA